MDVPLNCSCYGNRWILGMLDIGLNAIELGIALSVLVLGLTIALNSSFNKLLIYLFVALFATFHGYACLKYQS